MEIYTFDKFDQMPTKTGIYFYYDENNVLLYLGKAKNFRERMRKHMNEHNDFVKYFKLAENVNKDILTKMSEKEFERFSWLHSLYGGSIQPIDQELHQVKKIEFLECFLEELDRKEEELIEELKPPFNRESDSDEYGFIVGRFWDVRNLIVDETRRRKPDIF